MMLSRTHQTAAWVRMIAPPIARARLKRGRGKRIPRQIYPRTIEREYVKALTALIHEVSAVFRSELLPELPGLLVSAALETRIDSARLDAGESKRVRRLIEAARKKMNESLLTPSIEKLAEEFAQRTSSAQRIQLGKQVHAALGVDLFGADARIRPMMEAFVDSNVGLIRKLTDEVAGRVETSVLRAVQDAKPWEEFASELQDQFGFGETRARIIARDQIGKFYGQANAARQRELGIRSFIWRTSNDERVRPEHEALDGQVFSYDNPPAEGLPGEPILCRCSAEPVFDDIAELVEEENIPRSSRTVPEDGVTRLVPSREIFERGYFEPEAGLDPRKLEKARRAIAEGQRDPVTLVVGPEGAIELTDGRHRLRAATEAGAKVLVKFERGSQAGKGGGLIHVGGRRR